MTISITEIFPGLTRRQREVCALMLSGRSNREISKVLGIGSRTVETHRYDIFRALEVESAAQLMWKAYGSPEVIA